MYGTIATRAARAMFRGLRAPREGRLRARDLLFRNTPIGLRVPWLSWPAIVELVRFLGPGMRVLEYGGGGSTLFLLERGCAVRTVELSYV